MPNEYQRTQEEQDRYDALSILEKIMYDGNFKFLLPNTARYHAFWFLINTYLSIYYNEDKFRIASSTSKLYAMIDSGDYD